MESMSWNHQDTRSSPSIGRCQMHRMFLCNDISRSLLINAREENVQRIEENDRSSFVIRFETLINHAYRLLSTLKRWILGLKSSSKQKKIRVNPRLFIVRLSLFRPLTELTDDQRASPSSFPLNNNERRSS